MRAFLTAMPQIFVSVPDEARSAVPQVFSVPSSREHQ